MAKPSLGVSLAASILLLLWVLIPPGFAGFVASGEIDSFGPGISTEPVMGYNNDTDLVDVPLTERTPSNVELGNVLVSCDVGPDLTIRADDASATNLTTNLTHFEEGYFSYIMTDAGCDGDALIIATTELSLVQFVFPIEKDDFVDSEIFSFVTHWEESATIYQTELLMNHIDISGVSLGIELLDTTSVNADETGEVINFVLTTPMRLLVDSTFPSNLPIGEQLVLVINLYVPLDDLPLGELVIFDAEASATRDGLLTNAGTIIIVGVIWFLLSIPILIASTKWATWAMVASFGTSKK